MPRYKVTLIERVIEADDTTFEIEAASPADAAYVALAAVPDDTDADGARCIVLPDGQAGSLEPREVTHSEVTAEVRAIADDTPLGVFGYSLIFDPGIEETHALCELLERAILDTAYPECIEASRRLLAYLRAQCA
ncbi:hypothetical protein K2X14_14580 [Acetobacter sp. TBRC 12305]|uniref:Uncharacterized protein n=1 Tax=Acetobacter garciniae TaxID=2817435 RepID=A0A939KRU9_9PROT|nr:hypothetical protein [Acetobacter garciniae]MBO1326201.1 hypothetical protein [Acetobacter garciniae]MBX0346062.1 hypothetical protein [Acetobacter garciniae]